MPCTVFAFDLRQEQRAALARNALQRARTLRHSELIVVLDTLETESFIYIVTEQVKPLKLDGLEDQIVRWGLYTIASACHFFHQEAECIHGNIRAASVFVSPSGQWKLFGYELISDATNSSIHQAHLIPDTTRYYPEKPEADESLDSWMLGCLIYEIFNGTISSKANIQQGRRVPRDMISAYKGLVESDNTFRTTVTDFLEQGLQSFFSTRLISYSDFLNNIQTKTEQEVSVFLSELLKNMFELPSAFHNKAVMDLLRYLEYGDGGASVIQSILAIHKKRPVDSFSDVLTPVITRMFQSPNRFKRFVILDSLTDTAKLLQPSTISNTIFPLFMAGFNDPEVSVREATIRSVMAILEHLTDRQKNNELLKGLSRTQVDEAPGIRANTTICLGKLAPSLYPSSRGKILIAAFTRSLRDPFNHARHAGLMALQATMSMYTLEEAAAGVLPNVVPLLAEKDKSIRELASKVTSAYLEYIASMTSELPDTQTSSSEAGEGWASWTMSSIKTKVASVSTDMMEKVVEPETVVTAEPAQPMFKPAAKKKLVVKPTVERTPTPLKLVKKETEDDDEWAGW